MATQPDTTISDVQDINTALRQLVASAKMLKNPNHSLNLLSTRLTWDEKSGVDRLQMTIETKSKHPLSESYWQRQAQFQTPMSLAYPSAYYKAIENDLPNMLHELLSVVPPFRDLEDVEWTGVDGPRGTITVPHPFDIDVRFIDSYKLGEDDPETAEKSTPGNGSTAIAANGANTDKPAVNTPNENNDTDDTLSSIGIDRLNISNESNTATGTNVAVDKVIPVAWVFTMTLSLRPPALATSVHDEHDPIGLFE
ncbi:MAG: hypothetical protein TREMPRED_003634 [Tremellales sp. Tagirdzhanova-0007]|nr:MAG: hypothetical protein TREMPRED_003634 [Tremellales sp. Tagirdzhanova-0007]